MGAQPTSVPITSGDCRATIATRGAGPSSLTLGGQDLLEGYEVTGSSAEAPFFANLVLAPWPNRTDPAAFEFDGERHQFELTEPSKNTALHGLVADRMWTVASGGEGTDTPDTVELELSVAEEPGWPWPLHLSVVYRVTDSGLQASFAMRNDADAPMHRCTDARGLRIPPVSLGAASLLAGLAPSFGILVAARLAQGAGEALAAPAAMSVIVLMVPEGPLRSRALGVWAAVASSGLVLGFILSGVITEFLGWRWVFLISVPFVALVLVAALVLVPAGRTAPRDAGQDTTADISGALLLTVAPLLFIAGVVEAGETARPWWVPTLLLIGAVIAAVALVKVERQAVDPLLPPKILAHRSRLGANGATMLLSAALSSSFLLFTFLLQDRMGLSPLTTGLNLVPLALSLIVASVHIPRLIERWGAQACALTGMGCAALGMVAIAVAAAATDLDAGTVAGPLSLLPAMLLIAAGMGFGIVALQYVAVSRVTDEDAATASGVQRAADQLGGATGVALFIGIGFSPVLTGGADTLAPYVLSAALAVVGLAAGAVVV